AIGILAYLVAALIHEGGHAVTGIAFGIRTLKLTSFDVDFDSSLLMPLQRRGVSAAGILCNFLLATLILILFRKALLRAGANLRYFLWLLGYINLFVGGGYMMALSFVPFGDMNSLLSGLPAEFLLRLGTTALGVLIMLFALVHGAYALNSFLGTDPVERKKRTLQLSVVPYLAGCFVNTFSAVFAGAGGFLILCSAAAASFGGTSWMLMMVFPIEGGRRLASDPPLTPHRSLLWIVLGLVAAALNFGVFGRGVRITF
ncbi:MAG TPA: hypothetical protein VKU00_24555, partial [Chthonomonadaceae bacterium]|nr:hypothetical protein [Chthonomonadaceae bacterium]